MRERLTTVPVLGYLDLTTPYLLDTDASDVGVGAVLSQVQDRKKRVISYYSKTLGPWRRTTAPPERSCWQ